MKIIKQANRLPCLVCHEKKLAAMKLNVKQI